MSTAPCALLSSTHNVAEEEAHIERKQVHGLMLSLRRPGFHPNECERVTPPPLVCQREHRARQWMWSRQDPQNGPCALAHPHSPAIEGQTSHLAIYNRGYKLRKTGATQPRIGYDYILFWKSPEFSSWKMKMVNQSIWMGWWRTLWRCLWWGRRELTEFVVVRSHKLKSPKIWEKIFKDSSKLRPRVFFVEKRGIFNETVGNPFV